MRLWGLPPSPLTVSLTIFMTSLTEFCVFFTFFSFQFPTEHRLCLPAWCAFALPRLSPMETPSPSRHSTDSTATPSTGRQTNWKIDCWFYFLRKVLRCSKNSSFPPFSGHMALERGVWDQKGLATTPWSPVLTLSMGVITSQAESNSKFVYCNL